MDYKRKRQEGSHEKLELQVKEAEQKRSKKNYYQRGEGLDNNIPLPVAAVTKVPNVCPYCGKTGHKTKRSKKCLHHEDKSRKQVEDKDTEEEAVAN